MYSIDLTCLLFILASTYVPLCIAEKSEIHSGLPHEKIIRGGSAQKQDVAVNVNSAGSFELKVGAETWIQNAPAFFRINNRTFTTADGSLVIQKTENVQGEDVLGRWEGIQIACTAGETNISLGIKGYASHPAIVFEQLYPDGAVGTSVGDKDSLVSGFPGFQVDCALQQLGYMAFGGLFVGQDKLKFGKWCPDNFNISEGLASGPMGLFDRSGHHALFISPFNAFMAASAIYNKTSRGYYWGVMGNVKSVPKHFSYKTIVYYGAGINRAIEGWGKVMRTYYNKRLDLRNADFTNNYLSYWSDNGAYYVNYYVKGGLVQNRTYQDDLILVKQYADAANIPYRSIQYSVWFQQGKFGGNGIWNASHSLFPKGIKNMFQKTGLQATAHSRYWSPDTPYAKQNGGQYDFFVEKRFSLPYEERFWTDMFSNSQQWGFVTYMQDWLNQQFGMMSATTDNVHVGRTWLMQMGEGARKNDITIQYCMSQGRHILQSLEIPAVTQIRASNDYQPNDDRQWRLGVSSMFCHAVGLAPFKDTFWTTTHQPGNFYHKTEPFPALEAVVATLSTGPVGPGDIINGTDRELLMRCCAKDGLILKPSRPAMAIDAQILQAAFGGSEGIGPQGEVWTTYSDIGHWRFGIIFATDLRNSFKLGVSAAGMGKNFPYSVAYTTNPKTGRATLLGAFTDQTPLHLDGTCTKLDICLFYTSPVFKVGGRDLVLLGEVAKWVPISSNRVTRLAVTSDEMLVSLRGSAGERVQFDYVLGGQITSTVCVISPAGTATLRTGVHTCY